MKTCSTCKEVKPLTCFGKDKRSKNGLRSQCKECEKKYRINGEKNRDLEKKHTHAKQYRDKHKDVERARLLKWKTENPEKRKEYRTRNKIKNRCRVLDYDKDITLEKLYNRDGGICALCGGRCDFNDFVFSGDTFIAGNKYPSIDHIIPLSKNGGHTWDNVQLAHKQCNSIKSNKIF